MTIAPVFCTLFNQSYFSRGMAMCYSLLKYMPSARIYVFAFDDLTVSLLNSLNLRNLIVISLADFENEKLLEIKKSRTLTEYCWSSTPFTIRYVFDHYNETMCTYLDADLYFFNSPICLFDELGNKSVIITEHRYTPRYDQTLNCGKYCVQFMTFKNDKNGNEILNWWCDACFKWCYNRFEDGKFGDQKYLDTWTEQFEGVHELAYLGGGMAPWNIQQYALYQDGECLKAKNTDTDFNVIFYHFHQFKVLEDNKYDLGSYTLTKRDAELLYQPYVAALKAVESQFKKAGYNLDLHGTSLSKSGLKDGLKRLKHRMQGNHYRYIENSKLERITWLN